MSLTKDIITADDMWAQLNHLANHAFTGNYAIALCHSNDLLAITMVSPHPISANTLIVSTANRMYNIARANVGWFNIIEMPREAGRMTMMPRVTLFGLQVSNRRHEIDHRLARDLSSQGYLAYDHMYHRVMEYKTKHTPSESYQHNGMVTPGTGVTHHMQSYASTSEYSIPVAFNFDMFMWFDPARVIALDNIRIHFPTAIKATILGDGGVLIHCGGVNTQICSLISIVPEDAIYQPKDMWVGTYDRNGPTGDPVSVESMNRRLYNKLEVRRAPHAVHHGITDQ